MSKKQATRPYYAKFSLGYYCRLAFCFAHYFIFHLIKRPYRQNVPAIEYKQPEVKIRRRSRDALYDAMFHLLLDSYTELTGQPIQPATGQMLYFLSGLLASFDACFESRLKTDTSLALEEVMAEPLVQEKIKLFESYLRLFNRTDPVLAHLRKVFAQHYAAYVETLQLVEQETQFEHILASVHLDSGIELCCLLEVAGLFNGNELPEKAYKDFYHFGIVGKFADDIVDISRDIREESPNLLYTLIRQYTAEHTALLAAMQTQQRLTRHWWIAHCPHAFTQYFKYVEDHFSQISTSKLRFACDLTMVPAMMGVDYDASRWEPAATQPASE